MPGALWHSNPALLAIGAAGHASAVATALHAALLDEDIVEAAGRSRVS